MARAETSGKLAVRAGLASIWEAVTELVAQRSLLAVLAVAALATSGGLWWREFNFGARLSDFVFEFGVAVRGLVALGLMVVGVAQTLQRALDNGTAAVALTSPAPTWAWMAGRAGGVWLVVAAQVAASTAVLAFAVGQTGEMVPWTRLLAGALALLAKAAVLGAMVAWLASFGRSAAFAVLGGVMLWGAGQLKTLAPGGGGGGLSWVLLPLPDLALFDAVGRVGDASFGFGLLVYAAIFVGGYGGLAAVILRRREF